MEKSGTAKDFLDDACERTGLDLALLAEALGYSARTLKRVASGEVKLSPIMRAAVEKLASRGIHALSKIGNSPVAIVRRAMAENGMDVATLAKKMGRQIGVVQAVLNGSRASEGLIEDFCRVLHLDKRELMANDDAVVVLQENGAHGLHGQKPAIALPPGMKARYVPLFSFAQAGAYDMAHTDEAWAGEGFVAFDLDDRKAFALRIEGDSMSPAISPGDVVVVAPSWQLRRGETVVAKTTDGDVFCKVWGGDRDGTVILLSNNALHPELRIPREQIAWIYPVAQHTRTTRRA